MRKLLTIFAAPLLLASCSEPGDRVVGTWKQVGGDDCLTIVRNGKEFLMLTMERSIILSSERKEEKEPLVLVNDVRLVSPSDTAASGLTYVEASDTLVGTRLLGGSIEFARAPGNVNYENCEPPAGKQGDDAQT